MKNNVYITHELITVSRMMQHVGNKLYAKLGITERMYEILYYIDHGINTTVELSKIMHSTLPAIAYKSKSMERNGFIKRSLDKKDKRIWRFSITEKGLKTSATIETLFEKATEKLYSEFTAKQKKEALGFLHALKTHLDKISDDDTVIQQFTMSIIGK